MNYTGYFPMAHWRHPKDDEEQSFPDRGWMFLVLVAVCLVVAATGLAML